MGDFSSERFKRLHAEFLDAAARFPNLYHAIAYPLDPTGLDWPCLPFSCGSARGSTIGLPASGWQRIIGQEKSSLTTITEQGGSIAYVVSESWLQIGGVLWDGVYFADGHYSPLDSPLFDNWLKTFHATQDKALAEFGRLAKEVLAAIGGRALPPQGPWGLLNPDDTGHRWLEVLYGELRLGVASEEDAFRVMRLPCNIFSASAQAIDAMKDQASSRAGKTTADGAGEAPAESRKRASQPITGAPPMAPIDCPRLPPERDTTPSVPRPEQCEIDEAQRDLAQLLQGSPVGLPLLGENLVQYLRRRDHSESAAHWALHDLIASGLLILEPADPFGGGVATYRGGWHNYKNIAVQPNDRLFEPGVLTSTKCAFHGAGTTDDGTSRDAQPQDKAVTPTAASQANFPGAKTEQGEGRLEAGDDRQGRLSNFLRQLTAYESAVRNAREREFFPLESGHPLYDSVENLGGLPGPEPLTTWLNLRNRSRRCGTVKGWRNRQRDILTVDIPRLRAWAEGELTGSYDVLLAHNSSDKPAVRRLKRLLQEKSLRVWLDEDELRPGLPWQRTLEAGIKASRSIAVLVGKDGLGPWENEEMDCALNLAVRDKRPVIPVLLPGATKEPALPMFLGNRTWVDLRGGYTEEGLAKLLFGITGKKPAA